jgi:prefoldin subunit 5
MLTYYFTSGAFDIYEKSTVRLFFQEGAGDAVEESAKAAIKALPKRFAKIDYAKNNAIEALQKGF